MMPPQRYTELHGQVKDLVDKLHERYTLTGRDGDVVRVVRAMLSLLEQHTVNGRGQCAICLVGRTFWRRPRSQPMCSVYAMLNYWLVLPRARKLNDPQERLNDHAKDNTDEI